MIVYQNLQAWANNSQDKRKLWRGCILTVYNGSKEEAKAERKSISSAPTWQHVEDQNQTKSTEQEFVFWSDEEYKNGEEGKETYSHLGCLSNSKTLPKNTYTTSKKMIRKRSWRRLEFFPPQH